MACLASQVRADWLDPLQLTDNNDIDGNPCISADGSKIAFNSIEAGLFSGYEEIWVVNSDGSGLTQLTNNTGINGNPCISGDGSKIAFSSNLGGDFEIWVISQDVDDTGRTVDYTPYLVGGGLIAVAIIGVVGYIVFRRRKKQ